MDEELIAFSRETSWLEREQEARGRVRRIRRGLYAPAAVDQFRSAIAAGALRLDAVASHETAARLWGLPVLRSERHGDEKIHLTRPRRSQGTNYQREGLIVHHAGLDPAHIGVIDGLPVTTAARTVVDLARSRPFRAGVVVADAALRLSRCSAEELQVIMEACYRWPGLSRARRVLRFADPRAESPLESISRVAFHEYELPAPILQATIGGYERADFLWAQWRVIGEADGMNKYTSPEVLRREKLREDGFAQLGFLVFRWTWADAYHRPDALAHRALMTLSRRGYRPEGTSR